MALYSRHERRNDTTFWWIRFWCRGGCGLHETRARHAEKAGTHKNQAKEKLRNRLGEVSAGTYRVPEAKLRPALTFTAFADRFLRDYAPAKGSGYYPERLKIAKAHFGEMPLEQVSRQAIDLFAVARGRQVGPATVRKDLTVLGTLFKMAVRWDVLPASPAVDLLMPREPAHRARYLTVPEWNRLHRAAEPWLRPILKLTVATGMRLKEVCELRWDDWDRAGGIIHVPENTKTGARPIPLGAAATEVLKGIPRRARSPWIFTDSAGQPYRTRLERMRISRATIGAMKRAKIEHASFFTLRHTAGSWGVQGGSSLKEVGDLLGHKNPLTTQRYAHLKPEHLRDTVRALDKNLGARTTPRTTDSKRAGRANPGRAVNRSTGGT